MINFGFHLSISKGISNAFLEAEKLNINTFQIFTRSSRGWAFNPLKQEEIEKFRTKKNEFEKNFGKIVVHMPYLPNLASPEKETQLKTVNSFLEEIKRCDQLGVEYLVTHLGSHKGAGLEVGKENIISILEKGLALEPKVKIILENTAGIKNSVGSKFSTINKIIESTSNSEKIGICFDTQHAFAAGYDLRTAESVEKFFERFDDVIGLHKLDVIHCNDSKIPLNGKSDRHDHIGLGKIGTEGFKAIFRNEISFSKPVILETPIDDRRDDFANLTAVRSLSQTVN
ncbi:MAG: deoxyribonuclease IV [Candidatus Hodarchaeales archaeon]|jgi:deoxyribonuclease-4